MEYIYEAYTSDSRIVKGILNAPSEDTAESILYREGYFRVLTLKVKRPKLGVEELFPSLFAVKNRDVIEFSRQLATLVESGIPIIGALGLLKNQERNRFLKTILVEVSTELEGGKSFSDALGKHSDIFSSVYCQIIKASEYTGNLALALRQAADYVEKNAEIKSKIARSLAYPSLVMLMAIAVVGLIVTVAFPPLIQLFTSLGAGLPWTTKLLQNIALFVENDKLYLLGGLVLAIVITTGYAKLPAGRLVTAKFLLKVPKLGRIILLRNMHQFCRTMSLLLETGIPLPRIMNNVIAVITNSVIRNQLLVVREKLIQGQGLSQPMSESGLFPELLVEMVVIGEKTGTLPSTLASVSDLYERTIEQEVRKMISILQNALLATVAAIVGFIGISMISPLYSILGSLH